MISHANGPEMLEGVVTILAPSEPQGSGSINEAILITAEHVRTMLSEAHGRHYGTLRDALFHGRRVLSGELAKRLQALNAAASFIRHSSERSLAALREEVTGAGGDSSAACKADPDDTRSDLGSEGAVAPPAAAAAWEDAPPQRSDERWPSTGACSYMLRRMSHVAV